MKTEKEYKANLSIMKKDIMDVISSVCQETPVEGYELSHKDISYHIDLLYRNKNIAVVFHSIYYDKSYPNDDHVIEPKYFVNRYIACSSSNIRLINIYEQDYFYKKDKILKFISDLFKKNEIIFARNCTILPVNKHDKIKFINEYHLNGDSNQGSIAYGLYYKNELMSIMTFGMMRGQNPLRKNEGYYELVRFVNKDNYVIVGGASKLFTHFVRDYNPKYILCYSDNDFFTGDTYKKLGFEFQGYGDKSLNYQWCSDNEALQRQTCMVHKLLKKYPKYNDIEISGSKENYIMGDLGYYKVYRCSASKWIWKTSCEETPHIPTTY